jgi:DNA-directed RNA polymerase specialized sigma54-like protein
MTVYFSGSDIAQYFEQGPLNCVIPAYADLLSRQGYSKLSAHQQLRFLADMNRWLLQKRLSTSDLTAPTIQRYLRSRYRRLRPRRDDVAISNRLVHMLRTQGLLAKNATRLSDNPHQHIDNDFDHYLSVAKVPSA